MAAKLAEHIPTVQRHYQREDSLVCHEEVPDLITLARGHKAKSIRVYTPEELHSYLIYSSVPLMEVNIPEMPRITLQKRQTQVSMKSPMLSAGSEQPCNLQPGEDPPDLSEFLEDPPKPPNPLEDPPDLSEFLEDPPKPPNPLEDPPNPLPEDPLPEGMMASRSPEPPSQQKPPPAQLMSATDRTGLERKPMAPGPRVLRGRGRTG
jgi:hypothetical protein